MAVIGPDHIPPTALTVPPLLPTHLENTYAVITTIVKFSVSIIVPAATLAGVYIHQSRSHLGNGFALLLRWSSTRLCSSDIVEIQPVVRRLRPLIDPYCWAAWFELAAA